MPVITVALLTALITKPQNVPLAERLRSKAPCGRLQSSQLDSSELIRLCSDLETFERLDYELQYKSRSVEKRFRSALRRS